MNSPRRSTICVKTSGDTRQSLNISSRRCAHAGVIFSPPHLGLSRGHIGWRRLIQQEVTGCNEGQKMRDSKCIDLAKHVFQVCMVTPTGTLKTNTAVARGKLLALIARQPPALIFMEACGGAHDWARRFCAMGHEVRLLAPQYVTPYRRGQKNDPNDALALTEAGQRPNIPTVPIKTIEQQDLQALHRVRERIVKNRTTVVNQVRGLLLEYGIVIP